MVEVLFPVDVVNAGLDFLLGFEQGYAFLVEESLALGDGGGALQAEVKVVFHFLDAHAAAFETGEVFDPFDIAFIEDAAVVVVAFDIGDKTFIAVVFQGLIGHVGFFADLHHRIHRVSPFRCWVSIWLLAAWVGSFAFRISVSTFLNKVSVLS